MKIFKVFVDPMKVDFDEHDAFICYASSVEEALGLIQTGNISFPWGILPSVAHIGEAEIPQTHASIILASFHAG